MYCRKQRLKLQGLVEKCLKIGTSLLFVHRYYKRREYMSQQNMAAAIARRTSYKCHQPYHPTQYLVREEPH